MKRIAYSLIVFSFCFLAKPVFAYHNNLLLDAGDIISGTLPNARLDPSSATLQGNAVSISSMNNRVGALEGSTASLTARVAALEALDFSSNTYSYDMVVYSTNAANMNQSRITAKMVEVMGDYYASVSTICDIAKNGVGGLDVGAEQANTWYSLWFISNGTQIGVLLSSFTDVFQPQTLPTGYTKWRRVAYLFNDGSSNFKGMVKRGKKVVYNDEQIALDSNSPATSNTDVSLNNFVSTNAISATINVVCIEGSGNVAAITLKGKSFQSTNETIVGIDAAGATDVRIESNNEVPLFNERTIQYKQQGTSSMDQVILYVLSYEEDL